MTKKTIRDKLLEEGTEWGQYIMQETEDKSHLLKPKVDTDQKQKVPKDLYQTGKSEKQVREECQKYLKAQGWIIKSIYTGAIMLGNVRASNPAKGIPDQIIFKGNKKVWIEYKANNGGYTTIYQRDWHTLLKNSGDIVFIVTSLQSLINQLKEI